MLVMTLLLLVDMYMGVLRARIGTMWGRNGEEHDAVMKGMVGKGTQCFEAEL